MSANPNTGHDCGPDNWEEWQDLQNDQDRRRVLREQAELADYEDSQ